MAQRRFISAWLAVLLQSGASLSAVAAQSSAAPATAVSPRPAMPTEACEKTADGFGAFFETIVTDPALREAYSTQNVAELDLRNPGGPVRRKAERFRIALIDSRWAYDETEKDVSTFHWIIRHSVHHSLNNTRAQNEGALASDDNS